MVVVDANLLVALVSGDPRGNKVFQYFTDWLTHNEDIHAPSLARYETASEVIFLRGNPALHDAILSQLDAGVDRLAGWVDSRRG